MVILKVSNYSCLASIFAILYGGNSGDAVAAPNADSAPGRSYLQVGIEPASKLLLGYEWLRQWQWQWLSTPLTPYLEGSTSLRKPQFDESKLALGVQWAFVDSGRWQLHNRFESSVARTSNRNFDSSRLALADELLWGYYAGSWFVAQTSRYEKFLFSYIEHTDFYRETYYEDAEDGWYQSTGGVFQFGVQGGVAFGEQIDIRMELSYPMTERFNSYRGSPLHGYIELGYRF